MNIQTLIDISTDCEEVKYATELLEALKEGYKLERLEIINSPTEHVATIMRGEIYLNIEPEEDSDIIKTLITHFLDNYYRVQELSCSRIDNLTQVRNRHCLSKYLDSVTDLSTVIMVDLDNFKTVNDTFGHLEGDKVLKSVGKFLMEQCSDKIACFRYGGDEFLLIPTVEMSREETLNFLDDTVTDFILQDFAQEHRLTLSIGVAFKEDFVTASKYLLIEYADKSLYVSKFLGKNRVTVSSVGKLIFYHMKEELKLCWNSLTRDTQQKTLAFIKINSRGSRQDIIKQIRKTDVAVYHGNNVVVLFDSNLTVDTLRRKYTSTIAKGVIEDIITLPIGEVANYNSFVLRVDEVLANV